MVPRGQSLAGFLMRDDRFLVKIAHRGNSIAEQLIIHRYTKLVKSKAKLYFLAGADGEDMIQEGLIGLYKAVRKYDHKKFSSFKSFAQLCIRRQMITAIKTAARKKHNPLNLSVPLNQPLTCEKKNQTPLNIVAQFHFKDPMSLYLREERFNELKSGLEKRLSYFEKKTLNLYLDGKTYREIAGHLNKSVKSIDNALQRIKRKLEFVIKID